MIRPLTIVTFLMASGSGLYLYQSKHEVQLLDRTIERTVHDSSALREQSRRLAAEWTMLNDPERLRQFSDTYLSLKTINPSQFTSLADLNNRLPAPQVEAPPVSEEEEAPVPVATETGPQPAPDPAPADVAPAAVATEVLPVPPIPAAPPAPVVAMVARPAEMRVSVSRSAVADSQARSASIESRSTEQRATSRVAEAHLDVRPPAAWQPVAPPPRPIVLAAPRPVPASVPVYASPMQAASRPAMVTASAPYTGSLLGMARSSMPPAPRPTPVNATYNSN